MKFKRGVLKIMTILAVAVMMIPATYAQDKIDPFIGDWQQSKGGKNYAQVYLTKEGVYKANITQDLTSIDAPIAVLTGEKTGSGLTFSADGWNGKLEGKILTLEKGSDKMVMNPFVRTSPTMNAPAPKGAIVLFDGKNLDAFLKAPEKDWLEGSGAPGWKILPGGIVETVPHAAGLYEAMVTKQKFGDIKVHLEFRLLGPVTNGGVYFMSRYEMNIKEAYGLGNSTIAFGNISKPNITPKVNVAFPAMQWQTFDIDFRAPRFDASGTKKTENARITVVHNGVLVYDNVELEAVKGSTGKLGEAAVGPLYLQEHGTAYQFRNIWLIDKTVKGTENGHVGGLATSDDSEGKGDGGKKGGETKKGGGKKKEGTAATETSAVQMPGEKKKGGNKGGGSKGGEVKLAVATPGTDAKPKKGGSSKKKADPTSMGERNPAYAATTVSIVADPSGKPAKATGFIHPGVLVNRPQLDELKRRVAAGIEPQKTAFETLKTSEYAALDYAANPRDTVSCGPYSNPNLGCKDEQNDCAAAYSQALMWAITGNKVYAENAIKIMNAWSTNLVGGHNYANGPVQAAWAGSVWPRAAEIIRYTYTGWSDKDIAKFQNMLRVQYLPSLIHGDCENGNKELAMAEAIINIGVFNDDRSVYDLGVEMWRKRTPAYIYLKSDGPTPVAPPGCGPAIWSNKGLMPELVDGILQETARDAHHPGLGFSSIANAAETARQQGLDLYAEEAKRLTSSLEFTAQYLAPNNKPKPANLEFSYLKTWEIAYNHYVNRMGMSLPYMKAVIPKNRPTGVDHQMVWETLTHGDMGSIGIPPLTKK